MHWVGVVGDVVLVAAIAGLAVFTFSYFFFFRWWQTTAGKAVLFLTMSLLALLASSVLRVVYGGHVAGIVRVIAFGLVAASSWGLVITLWTRYQPESTNHQRNGVLMASKYASTKFWLDTLDRAIATVAQAGVATLTAGVAGILDVDPVQLASVAGLAGVVSVLTSVAFRGGADTQRPSESS